MQKNKRIMPERYCGAGFTIAEMLIALAISALLLAAVATAFNASFKSYTQNENIFWATNKARQALTQITSHLRTAQAVDLSSTAANCSLIASDGSDITYRYDASQGKLYLVTNDDLLDSDYLVCDGLSAMAFDIDSAVKDGISYVRSVQISLTVAVDQTEKTLTSAAVLRKNLD